MKAAVTAQGRELTSPADGRFGRPPARMWKSIRLDPGLPAGGTGTEQEQLKFLKGQAEYLADALEGIRKQIEALQAKAEDK